MSVITLAGVPRPPTARQVLLDAALAELVVGRGQMDLASVVRRTGLTTGAVYHHFGSKTGLIVAVYTSLFDELDAAIADNQLPDDVPWPERQRLRTRRLVYHSCERPMVALMFFRSAEPEITRLQTAWVDRTADLVAQGIEEGQRLGHIPSTIDPAVTAAFIAGGTIQGLNQQLRRSPSPDPDVIAAEIWRLIAAATRMDQPS
jgi:AcrR family transcriptional regulator